MPDASPRPPAARARAFTMMEVLVVVVILGVLAAIVIPQFANASDSAKASVFVTNLDAFNKAALLMYEDTGAYPEDATSGTLPTGFGDYIDESRWLNGTPIGGVWDCERDTFGFRSSLGVHFQDPDDVPPLTYMTEIDARVDNGDLGSGAFQDIVDGERYYQIVDARPAQ